MRNQTDVKNRSWIRPTTFAGVATVCIALVLSACSGSSKSASTTAAAGASPAEAALGLDKKSLLQREIKVESYIATCMKDQGFDYIAKQPSAGKPGAQGVSVPGLSDDEFRKQYGYGISTLVGAVLPAQAVTDPNIKIRSALAKTQQTAYDTALFGSAANADSGGGSFANAMAQGDLTGLGGCTKLSTEKAFGGSDVLKAVGSALDELDKRVASDPRLAKAQKDWSGCMNTAGFAFSTGDGIDGYISKKLDTMKVAERSPVQYDAARLSALQAEEIKLAQTDFDCASKFLTPVETIVTKEVEQKFVNENPALAAKAKG